MSEIIIPSSYWYFYLNHFFGNDKPQTGFYYGDTINWEMTIDEFFDGKTITIS